MKRIYLLTLGIFFIYGCKTQYVSKLQYDRDIDMLKRANEQLAKRNKELEAEILSARYAKASEEAYLELSKKLENMLKGIGPLSPYIEHVERIKGGLRIGEAILFDLGRAEIKKEGKRILKIIAEELKSKKGRINVIGHTDNIPIKAAYKRYGIKTNLELGMLRAKNVMLELIKAGIGEQRLSIQSYGSSKPILPNTTKQNRQKNRRVEIILEKE
jgi:chemotaxis protein MotB